MERTMQTCIKVSILILAHSKLTISNFILRFRYFLLALGQFYYFAGPNIIAFMLYLDLKRILGDRGITENPIHFLRRAGFTDHMANKLYYNKIDGTSYHN